MATKQQSVVTQTQWIHVLDNGYLRRRWLDSYEIEFPTRRRRFESDDLLQRVVTVDKQVSPFWLHTSCSDRPYNMVWPRDW